MRVIEDQLMDKEFRNCIYVVEYLKLERFREARLDLAIDWFGIIRSWLRLAQHRGDMPWWSWR